MVGREVVAAHVVRHELADRAHAVAGLARSERLLERTPHAERVWRVDKGDDLAPELDIDRAEDDGYSFNAAVLEVLDGQATLVRDSIAGKSPEAPDLKLELAFSRPSVVVGAIKLNSAVAAVVVLIHGENSARHRYQSRPIAGLRKSSWQRLMLLGHTFRCLF